MEVRKEVKEMKKAGEVKWRKGREGKEVQKEGSAKGRKGKEGKEGRLHYYLFDCDRNPLRCP
jgi:hypothetical protein